MFLDNKLLKIDDVIKAEQLKLLFDFKNKYLPTDLLDLFKLNSDINLHITYGIILIKDNKINDVSKAGIFIKYLKDFFCLYNYVVFC